MASAAIKKAVAGRDKGDIRAALRIALTFDHNYDSGMFQEDVKYCENQGISLESLYEKWDGRDLLEGRDSEDSFETLLGHLSTNFARERLERLLKLGKKLWPQESLPSLEPLPPVKNQTEPQSTGTGNKERILSKREILLFVVIVIAILIGIFNLTSEKNNPIAQPKEVPSINQEQVPKTSP